jgi:hypothetical protein
MPLPLHARAGEKPDQAALLSAFTLETGRSGQVVSLGSAPALTGSSSSGSGDSQAASLVLELTPTPRWPDMMTAYWGPGRVLFSSKLFSAHVAPPEVRAAAGWLAGCSAGNAAWEAKVRAGAEKQEMRPWRWTSCSREAHLKMHEMRASPRALPLRLQGEVLDGSGWGVYAEDWRYYFDCMLAPVARQVCLCTCFLRSACTTIAPCAAC